MMEEEALKKLKVVELKELLQEKGLSVIGKKEELIQRLLSSAQDHKTASPKLNESKTPLNSPVKEDNASISKEPSSQKTSELLTIKSSESKKAMQMSINVEDELEKIKARQARFGTVAPILQELEAAKKLQERKERFAAP